MSQQWYLTRDGGQNYGPYTDEQLKHMVSNGQVLASDMLWHEGMPQWTAASVIPGLLPEQPPSLPPLPPPPPASGPVRVYSNQPPTADSKRVPAGICAILVGCFGVHKFILGYSTAGLIMLLVTLLTCGVGWLVMGVIGIVEGIIYLTKSDAEFYQTYIVGKKEWF